MSDHNRSHHTLTGALRAVAEDEIGQGAAPDVEARLRQVVRAIGESERRRPPATFLATAAALVVVTAGAWRFVATHAPAESSLGRAVTREVATAFMPLTYEHLPVSDGHIVRLEVPRAALLAFGLASIDVPATGSETVEADVLVGPDGLARAVRFVRQVSHDVRNED